METLNLNQIEEIKSANNPYQQKLELNQDIAKIIDKYKVTVSDPHKVGDVATALFVFEYLIDTYITDKVQNKQVWNFVNYLIDNSNYFDAPASTRYHNNFEGGLLDHSMQVAINALEINKALKSGRKESDIVIAALFHDLGKAMKTDGVAYYIDNPTTQRQQQYGYVNDSPFKSNPTPAVFLTVPQRAVREVTRYIDISDEVYQSILIHDGQYVDENHPYKGCETPLALILHYADSWAGFIQEQVIRKTEDGKGYKATTQDKLGSNAIEPRKSQVTQKV